VHQHLLALLQRSDEIVQRRRVPAAHVGEGDHQRGPSRAPACPSSRRALPDSATAYVSAAWRSDLACPAARSHQDAHAADQEPA
jgi:hypothetical protein